MPECLYAVGITSRKMSNPTTVDESRLKKIVRYMNSNKSSKMYFAKVGDPEDHQLVGYCDSDHAGCRETRRSTTGYCIKLAGTGISCKSKIQAVVAISSNEAEYQAACAATQEVIALRQTCNSIGLPQLGPTPIHVDNSGAISLSRSHIISKYSKHIETRAHFVREKTESGEVQLIKVASKENIADVLTKPLMGQQLHDNTDRMIGLDPR